MNENEKYTVMTPEELEWEMMKLNAKYDLTEGNRNQKLRNFEKKLVNYSSVSCYKEKHQKS